VYLDAARTQGSSTAPVDEDARVKAHSAAQIYRRAPALFRDVSKVKGKFESKPAQCLAPGAGAPIHHYELIENGGSSDIFEKAEVIHNRTVGKYGFKVAHKLRVRGTDEIIQRFSARLPRLRER
jgi:hypothetical protein